MNRAPLSAPRIVTALAVAAFADFIQLPLHVGFSTIILSFFAFAGVIVVDVCALLVLSALLGFQWTLMLALLFEIIPGLGALPTWTLFVIIVVWRRKMAEQSAHAPVIYTQPDPMVIDCPAQPLPPAAPARLALPAEAKSTTIASRLAQLEQLRDGGHITAEEYLAERQRILGSI